MRKILLAGLALLALAFLFNGCARDAQVASYNISQDADAFKIFRRVVFYNGITDKYILVVEGYCSINTEDKELTVTVKLPNGTFLKHFLGLSDNVTYFAEQIQSSDASTKQYRVIFKPESILPSMTVQ